MTARSIRHARLRAFSARRGDRYGLLLLLLVFCYLLAAFTSGDSTTFFETVLFLGTLALALRTSHVRARTARLIIGGTVAGTAVAIVLVLSHVTSKDVAMGIANLWTGVVLLVTVGVIVRRVLTMPMVSLQSIFGAVSAYMIIGLMFAAFYAGMSHLDSRPFFASGSPGNTKTFQYFSFTTLTTLGYGDFTAAQNAGRAVAMMEALGGQVFLATLVARLVASFRPPPRRGDRGPSAAGRTDPGPTDLGPTDPGTSDPGTSDPGTSDPGSSAAGSSAAGRSDLGTSGPAGPPGPAGRPRPAGLGGLPRLTDLAGRAVDHPEQAVTGPGTNGRSRAVSGSRSRHTRQSPVKWHGRRRR